MGTLGFAIALISGLQIVECPPILVPTVTRTSQLKISFSLLSESGPLSDAPLREERVNGYLLGQLSLHYRLQ